MDLSPTDIQLVPFDLYKTDEKYDFQLTEILRRRQRPMLFIMDQLGDLVYSCQPDENVPDDRFAPVITRDLIEHAIKEARGLLNGSEPIANSVVRQVVINKPGEKTALVVIGNQFWCIRAFELDSDIVEASSRYAVLVDPIGAPQSGSLDLKKVKGLFKLTKRESEVVEELVSGSTDKQIARQIGISVETVRAYLKSVRAKLGVSTRTAIVSTVHNLRDGEPYPETETSK